MEILTLQEVRHRLDDLDQFAVSDSELRQSLASFNLKQPNMREGDPFSPAYRQEILHLYEQLFDRPYNLVEEGLDINVDHELAWGFPYGTQDSTTIGGFLIAYGFLIQTMNLAQGSRILEIGSGTGSLTRHLAKSGYRVTSLEVNASNVDLVNRMTADYPVRPQLILGNATDFEANEKFDAIIFFESFHHFIEHESFLKRCVSWLVEGGMIVFCAEPVLPDSNPALAYPWGLRLDGESLRGMYLYGWLELGFRQSYFDQLMQRVGLVCSRSKCADNHWSDVIVAVPVQDVAVDRLPRLNLIRSIWLNLQRLIAS